MTENKSPLRVGVAGLGTVGAGVINMLRKHAALYEARAGRPVIPVAVSVKDWTKDRDCDLTGLRRVTDPLELARDPETDVVVEVMGGSDGAAYHLVKAALEAGKSVVTANKALLAVRGEELFRLAEQNRAALYFEAAVAGGVPVIKTVRESLAGNRIRAAYGILNGTCNFILTSMESTGASFADALAEAQRLGYAEADPHFDVDGIDAGHKATLLAALCFGEFPQFAAADVQGVRNVTADDMKACAKLGGVIRLLGVARAHEDGTATRSVYPAFLPLTHPLAAVKGANNAIYIEAEEAGNLFLSGPGAGMYPTASAVLGDIIDVARGLHSPALSVPCSFCRAAPSKPAADRHGPYYFRLKVENRAGVLAGVTGAFAAHGVSLDRVEQYPADAAKKEAVVCGVTGETSERAFNAALAAAGNADGSLDTPSGFRAEGV